MEFRSERLADCESRIQRDFIEFSRLWSETAESWSDSRRKRFERERLSTLGPSLSRFCTAMHEFTEILQKANQSLSDADTKLS